MSLPGRLAAIGLLAAGFGRALSASPAAFGETECLRLRQARYATTGLTVPAEGIVLHKDVATFRFVSGRIFPIDAVHGTVTGFVFVGAGTFHMDVPDPFERAQLQRFAQKRDLQSVDTPFGSLVLRSIDPSLTMPAGAAPEKTEYAANSVALDRTTRWEKDFGLDVDGRIIASLGNPADDYLIADIDTGRFGWLTFEFEPWNLEEVSLKQLHGAGGFLETWVNLDRASERAPDGRPASDPHWSVDVVDADIVADLAGHRAELLIGREAARPDPVRFRCRLNTVVLQDGIRAVPLWLHPRAEVLSVSAPGGAPIPFLRDAYGERSAALDDDRFTGSLIVLPGRELRAGESFSLDVEYRMRTLNFVSGRSWYPAPPEGLNDLHTVRLTVKGPKRVAVCASGERVSDAVVDDVRTSIWEIREPTKMAGFSFGAGFREEAIHLDGSAEVVSFGARTGAGWGNTVRNVAVDVARSLKFFEEYYGVELPHPTLRVAAISGHHGQAFDGFLQVAQATYNEEHPGYSERFRAHEVAHQIWGHLVGWKSYRDQWLSEGFAEYSALMFVEAVLPKDKHFDLMIAGMTSEQLGSLRTPTYQGASRWGDMKLSAIRDSVGPIAAGVRASTARVPAGYWMQSYDKGALVLHTLRTVLSSVSRTEDVFRSVMRDFVKEYAGRAATTDDFRRVLERRVPGPWAAFFQAYVDSTELPSISWRAHPIKQREAGGWGLDIDVTMSDVPEGFAIPVPIALDFGDGKPRYTFLMLELPSKSFHFNVPSQRVKVTFNPGAAILARVTQIQ